LKRPLIIFILFVCLFTVALFSQNLVFFGNLSGRVFPENSPEKRSCFSGLSEYLSKKANNDYIFIDLGNSFYGSTQSVYYLVNEPENFYEPISDLYNSYSIIKCIGERDLYVEELLDGLNLYSCNILSEDAHIKRYLTADNGRIVFIPISIVRKNLVFDNFKVFDPFESLKEIIDLFDNDESKDKIIIVGISNDESTDVFSILDRLDDRVDLVIFESDLSGVFDINGKKVLALSGNDLLSLKVNGNNIEYSFEPLFNPSISPFEPKINEMSNWLNRELAVFAYKPRDYGFNGLNPVNTVAEFLTNIFEGSSVHSIPLIAFEDQNTNQKIRIKDVLKLLNHGTLFESMISGKDVEKILNDLIEEGTTFEIGNVNYIAQIDETNKTIKWLKYRGHEISKRSSFELITNVPTLDDLKFKVATKKLWNVLKQKRTSMKYVKNWYIINKPFEKEFRYYVVDWGDNIGTLALVFNKDAKLLMDMNGLKKPRELKAGDVLIIPMF